MALVNGTNCGFVLTAPVDDPASGTSILDSYAKAILTASPATANKITEIGWWCDNATAESNFEVGLYDSNKDLLYVERTNAKGTGAGWKTVAVDWEISPSTNYYIAVQLDNTATTTNWNFGIAPFTYSIVSADTLPDPWTGMGGGGGYSVYAVYKDHVKELTETLSLTDSATPQKNLVLGTDCGFVETAPTSNPWSGTTAEINTWAYALKVVAPSTAERITEIGWWADNATTETNFEVGIYAHNVGDNNPEEVVGSLSQTNAKGTAAGWKRVTGLNIPITEGTTYWIAVQCDNTIPAQKIDVDATAGQKYDYKDLGTLIDPWNNSDGTSASLASIYAVWKIGELFTETFSETLSLSEDLNAFISGRELTETLSLADSFFPSKTIKFVQYDDYTNLGTGGTIANDTALNTTTGNCLIVCVSTYDETVSSISDTAGNTYTKAIQQDRSAGTQNVEIWYAQNITGNASNVTTATFTGDTSDRGISVSEFSGISTNSPLEDTSYNSSSIEKIHTSGVATLSAQEGLVIGCAYCYSKGDFTLGTNFATLSSDLTDVHGFYEYKMEFNPGDYAATHTTVDDENLITACAIFSAASGESQECTETISLTESILTSTNKILSQTLSLSEDFSKVWELSREYSETIGLTDTYSKVGDLSRELEETLTLTEDYSGTSASLVTLSENLSLTDDYSRVWFSAKTISQTLSLSEDLNAFISGRELSETLTLTDAYSKVWDLSREFEETLTLTGDVVGTTGILKSLTETLTLTEDYSRVWVTSKTLSQTLWISDGDTYGTEIILDENLTLSEDLNAFISGRELTETLTLTETISSVLIASLELTETITLTDGDNYETTIILDENLTLSDDYSFTQHLNREYSETLNLAGTFSGVWVASLELTEPITLTESLGVARSKTLTETLTLSDGETYVHDVNYETTLSETLNLNDVNIVLLGEGKIILSANLTKPVLVSTEIGDYER